MDTMSEEEGSQKIKKDIVIEKAIDYTQYYAHGAQGTLEGHYDLKLVFFQDDISPWESQKLNKRVEEEGFSEDLTIVVTRELLFELILSIPAAYELKDWLIKQLGRYELKIKEEKEEIDAQEEERVAQ